MRFFTDLPEEETEVLWYFVPPSHGTVPYSNPFVSRVWEREDEPLPALGELYSPVPWTGGLPDVPVSSGGLCGTQDQWENGCLSTDPLPATWPGTDIPICCSPPPIPVKPETEHGARTVTTPCCPDVGFPELFPIHFFDLTGGCDPALDLMLPTLYTIGVVPAVPDLTKFWQSPPFDIGGIQVRLVHACYPTPGELWFFWVMSEDLTTIYNSGSLMNPFSCIPISLRGDMNHDDVGTCGFGDWMHEDAL